MTPPRVGLVGCGEWGRHILRDLRALGCEVSVVARSPESVGRAKAGGAVSVVPSASDLPLVEGIVVATSTDSHAESVERVIDRGVPVFVEKPLCPSLDVAQRLAARAPERIFVMDKWRYHPGVEAMRDIARSGVLGAVHGLRTVRVQWGIHHTDVDAVWILAPHDIAIAQEVLAKIPEPRAALAEGSGGSLRGIVGQLGERPWMTLEISSRHAVPRREVALHCEAGVALLDGAYASHLTIVRNGRNESEPIVDRQDISSELPLLRELRAFVRHLRGGPTPRSSAAEGVAVVAAIHRLRELAGRA